MENYSELREYIDSQKEELDARDFGGDTVEVEFVDAYMEIRWAFVEKKGDFVIVFAEHYPPLFQHVDETKWFEQRTYEGETVKSWENK